MKNIMILLLVIALPMMLFACGNEEAEALDGPDMEMQGFNCKVLEIHDGMLLVEPLEGEEERNSSDRITVPMENMEASPEIEVGDIIYVNYDGKFLESYPAQVENVYKISVIKEAYEMTDERLAECETPADDEVSTAPAKDVENIGDLISYDGEIASFQYAVRGAEDETVITLEGEDAANALSSLKENKIKKVDYTPNPSTGGFEYYVIKFSDGKEFKLVDNGALILYIDGKTDEIGYSHENKLDFTIPEGTVEQYFRLDENGNRKKTVVDPVMPNFFGSNQAMMYEAFLQKVNERMGEAEAAWGFYDLDIDGNIVIYEKNPSFTDEFLEEFFMRCPELMEKLEGKVLRKPCRFSIEERNKAYLEIETTDIFSEGKASINFSYDPDIINIVILEEGGKKEIFDAAERAGYPKENVKITLGENLSPINPSM